MVKIVLSIGEKIVTLNTKRLSVSKDMVTMDEAQLRYNTHSQKWAFNSNNDPRTRSVDSWGVVDN
jgi:hypothetical protein